MKELPLFQPIDTKTWPQAQEFWYYTQAAPTTYSVTVPLDVTVLRRTLKQRDVRFFPAYLWLVTRAVREVPELRVAVREGVLGGADAHLSPVPPGRRLHVAAVDGV